MNTTPRIITDHKLTGLNEAIEIVAADEPGPGGANHVYRLRLANHLTHPNRATPDHTIIRFQNGPIGESGVNGLSNEALIALVIDRIRGFQHQRLGDLTPPNVGVPGDFDFNSRGKFACRENAIALTHFEEGLMWLQKRTRDRQARGVEGRSVA